MTYGDPVPATTPAYVGFVGGDTAASLATAPACTTTYEQGNGAGTYPATWQGAADADDQISYAPGAVTVAPATRTVPAGLSGSFGLAALQAQRQQMPCYGPPPG